MLKRQPKNRRFERRHVLDVRLSSVQRRKAMLRLAGMALIACGMLVVGVFVFLRGGDWVLRRLIYENPAFSIHQLDIQTDGVFSLEQLRAWSGVRLRDNLLAVDIVRIKRDLELVPAIESVAVERILPHTLRIRVTERQAIAQTPLPQARRGAAGGRAFYTLDAEGFFMFPIEPTQRTVPAPTNECLPLITGIPAGHMRPGRQAELPQLRAALRLVQAFERSAMSTVTDLKQVDLSLPHVLQVTTGQTNEVLFGLTDIEGQLRRWRAVYDHGQKSGRQLAWIDLSVSNNVPVRWADPAMAAPSSTRTNQPSQLRKKHV